MTVSIVKQSGESITLQVTIPFNRSMLNSENSIQKAINELGAVATGELLKTFDTEGEDIQFGTIKMTSKGLISKYYQTPYGEVEIDRHVYQSSAGGSTFCPLEREARIILTATPRFAAQVSHKMAALSAPQVKSDFSVNSHRNASLSLIQDLSEAVSCVVQAKEESWTYHVPKLEEAEVKTIGIGLDGTCMLMCEGTYRQAMVGTISLKEKFKERLTREIERIKELYPLATKIGIADGAPDNWSFLEKHTDKQILDFYHATEYLTGVADEIFSSPVLRKKWLDDRCHQLKHAKKAAINLLIEMQDFKDKQTRDPEFVSLEDAVKKASMLRTKNSAEPEKMSSVKSGSVDIAENVLKLNKNKPKKREQKKKSLDAAITYFTNNNEKSRMNYWEGVAANQPIGSGVTEAACKTIVKQRLCLSGMRWKDKGAGVILSLRTLIHSSGRWEQFWQKVNQYGFPLVA